MSQHQVSPLQASELTDLLEDLGGSIYVHVVRCMTQGGGGLLSALVGLVATVLLQVSLLVLIALSAGDVFPTKRVLQLPDHIDKGVAVFLVTLLALCVLALYVLQEARCACKLGYAVAVYGGFIPGCWLLPKHGSTDVSKQLVIHTELQASHVRASVAALVPVVQLVVSLLCFVCGAWVMATFKTADVAGILINSVGIAFVLELDEKFGDLFSWDESTAAAAGSCVAVVRARGCRAAWGAAYRWLLLLLMACIVSAILLSPMLVLGVNLVRVVPAADNNALRIFGASAGILLAMLLVLSDMVYYHPLTVRSSAKQAAVVVGILFVLFLVSNIGTTVMFVKRASTPPSPPIPKPCTDCGVVLTEQPAAGVPWNASMIVPVVLGTFSVLSAAAATVWALPSLRRRIR
jgi:hypothetical protein